MISCSPVSAAEDSPSSAVPADSAEVVDSAELVDSVVAAVVLVLLVAYLPVFLEVA